MVDLDGDFSKTRGTGMMRHVIFSFMSRPSPPLPPLVCSSITLG